MLPALLLIILRVTNDHDLWISVLSMRKIVYYNKQIDCFQKRYLTRGRVSRLKVVKEFKWKEQSYKRIQMKRARF